MSQSRNADVSLIFATSDETREIQHPATGGPTSEFTSARVGALYGSFGHRARAFVVPV